MEILYALRCQRPEVFNQLEGMDGALPYFLVILIKNSVYRGYVKCLLILQKSTIKPTSGGVRRGTGGVICKLSF